MKRVPPGAVHAAVVVAAVAAGVGLRIEALGAGFYSDDYAQYAMLQSAYPARRSPLDLFDFSDGSPEEVRVLRDRGLLPWWSHPRLRLAMVRPLSSLLIVLDNELFGADHLLYHLHSLLWWIVLALAVALLYRELLPWRAAALATVFFALEEGNGVPLLWLANRNALVSLGLGLLGLWAHIRRRRGGSPRYAVASAALFALSLLGGEWAFTVFAYLLAFELFGVSDPVRVRARALLPAACMALAFLTTQYLLQYSVLSSAVYINPFLEPLVFLVEVCCRIPVFLAELVFGLSASWWFGGSPWGNFFLKLDMFSLSVWKQIPGWEFWHVLIGLASSAVAGLLIAWALRARDHEQRRQLGWLLLGALISLVPMTAPIPLPRSVLPASVGVSALWAVVLLQAVQRLRDALRIRPLRPPLAALAALCFLLYFQLWQASRRSLDEVRDYVNMGAAQRRWVLGSDLDGPAVGRQHVVLVSGVDHTVSYFTPFILFAHGRAMPRSFRVLSGAERAHRLSRTGPRVLELFAIGGPLLTSESERFFRADRYPMQTGDTVVLEGMRVEVLQTEGGKPLHVRFTFDRPLEDCSYRFLHCTENGMRRFELPAVGQQRILPIAPSPSLLLR